MLGIKELNNIFSSILLTLQFNATQKKPKEKVYKPPT